MPSPTSPSVPLTPKHAHRKYPDSSLTMVWTRCGFTPLTSTPASSSTPYHSLWPPCPLKDVCTSAVRPGYHVKSVGFPRSPESMRIWRTGAVWGVGVWTRSHSYFMKLIKWYWASICTPTHIGCTGAAVFSLISSQTGRILDPRSRSDIGSQNLSLTWRHCQILSPETCLALQFFPQRRIRSSRPWRALFIPAGVRRSTSSLAHAW